MPLLATRSFEGRYIPRFRIEPEFPDAYERIRATNPTMRDLCMPLDAFPHTAREEKGIKDIPDFFSLGPWIGISEQFRNILEGLEPGIHQYSNAVALFRKGGAAIPGNYYCFNPRKWLDHTIILEKSTARRMRDGRVGPSIREGELVLDRNIIGARHFWLAKDGYRYWFLSDELWAAISKAKLKKLVVQKHHFGTRD